LPPEWLTRKLADCPGESLFTGALSLLRIADIADIEWLGKEEIETPIAPSRILVRIRRQDILFHWR